MSSSIIFATSTETDVPRASQVISKQAEPRRPAAQHLEVIDRIGAEIHPDDPGLEEWLSRYLRQHRRRLALDLDLISREAPSEASVLECGAIPLLLTGALAALGYRICAVDLDPDRFATAIATLGLDVRRCDIETEALPFAAETFDVVLFNELLEHLRMNPIFTLGEVHRVLRPGGVLLLSTPNLRSFRGIRNLLIGNEGHAVSRGIYEQYEKLETLGHMGHVREYTSREVSDLVARIGFRVDKIVFRGGHGRGLVGVAERLAPAWRPFFTLRAIKPGSSESFTEARSRPAGNDRLPLR